MQHTLDSSPLLKTRFLSVTLPAISVLILVVALGIGLFVRTYNRVEVSLREKLTTATELAALTIEVDDVVAVQTKADMDSEAFLKLVNQLNAIRSTIDFTEYAYIFRRTDVPYQLEFVADADSLQTVEELDVNGDGLVSSDEEGSYPGDFYDIMDVPALQGPAWVGPTVDKEPTVDQWGSFISAYAPIRTPEGVVVAVLGVDVDTKQFFALSAAALPPRIIGVFFVLGILLALGASYVAWRRWENRRRLLTLMSNLPGMAYRCLNNENWTMEFVSEGCKALTGYESQQIEGDTDVTYGSLIAEEDSERVWQEVQQGIKSKQPFTMTYRIHTKDGAEKWVWEQGQGVYGSTGKLVALEGFITDITKQRHIDETKSQFMQLTSHILRTPLAGMRWSADLLLEEEVGTLEPDQRKLMNNVMISVERMTDLLNLLFRVSQLEEGGVAAMAESTEIRPVLEAATSLFEASIKDKKQSVEIVCDKDVTFTTDSAILQEVLSVLVHNASTYSPEGKTIIVSAKPEGDNLVVQVQDFGCGIPKDDQYRLFEKFFRAQNALTLYTDGAGLSLYLASLLVKVLGGSIKCESREDEGTTFTIRLQKKRN